jgi:hypothetical protein
VLKPYRQKALVRAGMRFQINVTSHTDCIRSTKVTVTYKKIFTSMATAIGKEQKLMSY